ncbi:Biopolymer transport protein ExbD [Pseudobythopirellula maris]|uniref:Biopolymer transport protein ExbD n=2 Tax=Pseudobythopirellula maris TaxID=2527991 RepID=A0A5C5ZU22_9BACT|nr:Biopolymer transport protein ExbD [Pseudobythopirellula maris]
MTPMIDVVFLLIIFFLVSSTLAKRETLLDLDLPTAASGRDSQADSTPHVTVNVDASGVVLLAGSPVQPAELLARLRAESERHEEGITVRVRSDRAADYASVEPVLAACAEAEVWNVVFAVYEDKQ